MDIFKADDFLPSENHTFGIFTLEHQNEELIHGHDFDEIIIVKEGCGFHIINNEVSFVYKGDAFIVRTSDFHSYCYTNNLSLINILVRRDKNFHYLKNIKERLDILEGRNVYIPDEELNEIVSVCNYINSKIDQDYDETYFFDVECNFVRILNLIFGCCHREKEKPTYNEKSTLVNKIKSNYKNNIEWERLCIESGMSKRSMFRFINDLTGLTPVKFVHLYRLLKSRELLKTTDMKVYEISEYCGFSNVNHFCELYKNIFKKNPTQEKISY